MKLADAIAKVGETTLKRRPDGGRVVVARGTADVADGGDVRDVRDVSRLVEKSPFRMAAESGLASMESISQALANKRDETRAKLRRAAALMQEAADVLNTIDA